MKSMLFNTSVVFFILFCFNCVHADMEFYPGFRRPDPILKWEKEQDAEEFALEQLTRFLQEQQRRLDMQEQIQRDPEPEPKFTFTYPDRPPNPVYEEFAVAPPNPLYYQKDLDDYDFVESDTNEEVAENVVNETPKPPKVLEELIVKSRSEESLVKSPLASNNVHQFREQDLNRFASGGYHHQNQDHSVEMVPVQPSLQDETAGVYIIAVVAGISAAATVGLIAFAIGWYNLQKNVKNSADVEYPAYGVTGPNKDVSPTGDRRLAQSAQMYHYQHQKQQIIAMESRAAATVRHGSMSEAESDEENEEGDYTVYECPGLAPTGEMEVKNPLFQDDLTPAAYPVVKEDGNNLPDQK